jgi:hypothetical protein
MPNNSLRHQRSESLLASIRPVGTMLTAPTLSGVVRDRSLDSLEQEIMRLQEVIREREAEIAILEKSTLEKTSPGIEIKVENGSLESELSKLRTSLEQDLVNGNNALNASDRRTSIGRLDELMRFRFFTYADAYSKASFA